MLLVVDGSLHPQTTMVLSSYPAILGDARIRVLGVTPWQARYPRIEVSEAEMLSAFPASMGSATIGASEMVNSLMERLGEDGLSTDAEVCSGDLVPTVIAAATDWRADLVVMVAESEEAPSAMLRGTMATRVLQGVTASMLIVRPRSD